MATQIEIANKSRGGVITFQSMDANGVLTTRQLGPGQKTSTFVKNAGATAAYSPTITETTVPTQFGPCDQPN